jgi:hypothetical protein
MECMNTQTGDLYNEEKKTFFDDRRPFCRGSPATPYPAVVEELAKQIPPFGIPSASFGIPSASFGLKNALYIVGTCEASSPIREPERPIASQG